MRTVQVYIEGQRIELFQDEQIKVNSSVKNIADISKVYTDFSQSFNVPASPHNNAIFEHFYQSDVDGTIDHNIRRRAKIEINQTDFRRGKIQLEKAEIKNGKAESYSITFYGDIRTLKDAFGEYNLNNLDLSALEFAYDGTEIYNRITDTATDYDVRFPLIANNRVWSYGDASSNDITIDAGAIQYDELFPAVKISKIFEAIETTYGLTFTGTFLSDPRFTNCFLFGKNSVEYEYYTENQVIDITSFPAAAVDNFDATEDTLHYEYETGLNLYNNFNPNNAEHITRIFVGAAPTVSYYIDTYLNGSLYSSTFGTGTNTHVLLTEANTSGLNSTLKFYIRANAAVTITTNLQYELKWYDAITYVPDGFSYSTINAPNVLSGNINLNYLLPEMKVSDFFTGVLRQFNATCVGTGVDTFEILPLEEWYQQGALVDITTYTDIDSIQVERIPLYKKISFKYEQSPSFQNRQFYNLTGREYGDLEYAFDYDGDEYLVQQPFENLLFAEFENSGVFAGFCLDESYSAYTPRPVLLYLYGSGTAATPIRFFDDTNYLDITNYAVFGQDIIYQTQNYSLNWGAEISIIEQATIQNGLYKTYYFPYLTNLYNLKNRVYQVKTILPVSLLTELRLNDRVIIRDKRYIINDMRSNLTTGEVNFSLTLDFRPIAPAPIIIADKDAQCIDVPINFINGAVQADISTTFLGVTITPSTIYESQTIQVCIPENTESGTYIITEDAEDYINTEEYERFITDESSTQVIILVVVFTLSNGSTAQTQIIITQP